MSEILQNNDRLPINPKTPSLWDEMYWVFSEKYDYKQVNQLAKDIIHIHKNRLAVPVNIEYHNDTIDDTPILFQLMDDWKTTGKALIRLQSPWKNNTFDPLLYSHIIHHELSHIYNDEYEHLRHNWLTNKQIQTLETIDKEHIFNNFHIEVCIKEAVTDLAAMQMQWFSHTAVLSFLKTVIWFLDTSEALETKFWLLRDIIRFKSIILWLAENIDFPPEVNIVLKRIQSIQADIQPLLHNKQKEYLLSTENYIQELSKQFFENTI
jgi:ACT domain-containing protein